MNTPPSSATHHSDSCVLLGTGNAERNIRFCPSLFQLFIERGEQQERVELGYAGSRLLERLLQSPGEVVAREELMAHAWPDRVVGQGSLNQQIYSLRQLFCDEKGRDVIQTLPRRGYQFNPSYVLEHQVDAPQEAQQPAPVVEVNNLTAPAPVPATQPPSRSRSRWPSIALFCSTLAVGLSVSAWVSDSSQQLTTRNLERGQVTLQLVADNEPELDALQQHSTALLARLAELSDSPTMATLDSHGGYVQLFCQQQSQAVNWLMFHPSQLASLSDDQLGQCLP